MHNLFSKEKRGVLHMKNILFFGIGDVGDAVMKTAVFKVAKVWDIVIYSSVGIFTPNFSSNGKSFADNFGY